MRRLLARAADEGSLVGDVSQEDLATAVVAATMGFLFMSRKNEEWLTGRSLTRFWRLMLPRVATPRVRSSLAPAGTDSVVAAMTPLIQTVPEPFPQPHHPY